jgi:hypothetical protein
MSQSHMMVKQQARSAAMPVFTMQDSTCTSHTVASGRLQASCILALYYVLQGCAAITRPGMHVHTSCPHCSTNAATHHAIQFTVVAAG